jgi:4-hydroxy-tetrahydrodipicolinate synthase
VYAEGSLEAARIAKMAAEGGAAALLVFPPGPFTMGQRPEMAVEHFRRVAGASELPIIAFQYPLAGGQGYPLATLLEIIEAVPQVAAIKDWCASPQLHERQIRTLQSLKPPVNVLTTHSSWLISSLVMGCNGLLSGSGSVIADLQPCSSGRCANDLTARRSTSASGPRPRLPEPWVGHAQPHEGRVGDDGQAPAAVRPRSRFRRREIEYIRKALIAAAC